MTQNEHWCQYYLLHWWITIWERDIKHYIIFPSDHFYSPKTPQILYKYIYFVTSMALDKRCISKYFSYFSMKTCCGYSLEVPLRGTSNEYPQHMFSWRNKKISILFVQKLALSRATVIHQNTCIDFNSNKGNTTKGFLYKTVKIQICLCIHSYSLIRTFLVWQYIL